MLERELKFHVPAHKRVALEKALRKLGAMELPLHACYFDTENYDLAKAKIALRLRKEGEQWVQTIKTPGPDELSRVEINHPRTEPTLDLTVYHGTHIGRTLAQLEHPLVLRYETLVNRLVLKKQAKAGAIEFAYDQGMIKAGALELPLCELELEQVSGSTDYLFTQAQQWLKQHGLILDLRSKAERGDALARIACDAKQPDPAPQQSPPSRSGYEALRKPRRASAVTLKAAPTLDAAYRLCANDCMNQIIRNATFLAGVDSTDAVPAVHVEYTHQLRVGIRRIRSCWKFFGKWVDIDETTLSAQLRDYFSLLGQARDNDVIGLVITPRLISAGMPELTLPSPAIHADHTQALAASTEFQATLLTLLHHLVAVEGTAIATEKPNIGKLLSKRLNKRLKRICRQGTHFQQLAVDEQHSLRKLVKGLRYSMEFSASLLAGKSFDRLRNALIDAQHTLGDLNDLYVAHDYYQPISADQPQALFAVGWLRAMQTQKQAQAQTEFTRLAKAGRFKAAKLPQGKN